MELDTNTRLAYERTYLAQERTQMAWVRTALSLISFGFAIAKFFHLLHEDEGEHAPRLGARTVGLLMIGIGIVVLIVADW
jgi:inner membrane protein YidH